MIRSYLCFNRSYLLLTNRCFGNGFLTLKPTIMLPITITFVFGYAVVIYILTPKNNGDNY